MVAAVLEPPSRRRHRLANSTTGDFELRHWRPAKKSGSTGMKGRWVPPEIEIPGGEAGSYTSLRDIMSSPEYAAAVVLVGAHSGDCFERVPPQLGLESGGGSNRTSCSSLGRQKRRRHSPLAAGVEPPTSSTWQVGP
jgi:hypothetical protein